STLFSYTTLFRSHGFLCNFYHFNHRFYFIAHIVILIVHLQSDFFFPVRLLELFNGLLDKLFTVCEQFLIKITYNIDETSLFDITATGEQMIETFSFLREFRCRLWWETIRTLHSSLSCMYHSTFRASRMYALSINCDFSCRSVETFILQLAKFSSVYGVSKGSPEIFDRKFMRATADFFIRSECYANRTMRVFRMHD